MNPPVDDMRVLGQLLRCPEGEKAQAVGDYLFSSNSQTPALFARESTATTICRR